jgi:hypothetical protein
VHTNTCIHTQKHIIPTLTHINTYAHNTYTYTHPVRHLHKRAIRIQTPTTYDYTFRSECSPLMSSPLLCVGFLREAFEADTSGSESDPEDSGLSTSRVRRLVVDLFTRPAVRRPRATAEFFLISASLRVLARLPVTVVSGCVYV